MATPGITHPDDRYLSAKEMAEAFRKITYHPDSSIEVRETNWKGGAVEVVLKKTVRNSYNPDEQLTIQISGEYCAAGGYTLGNVHHAFRVLAHNLETHESDEWIRYDGQMVFDPHAND